MNTSSQQTFFKGGMQYQDNVTVKWVTAGPSVKRSLEIDYEHNPKRVATDVDSLPTLIENNVHTEGIPAPSDNDEFNLLETSTNNQDSEENMNTHVYIGIFIPKFAIEILDENVLGLIATENQTELFRQKLENTPFRDSLWAAKTQPYVISGKRQNALRVFNWVKNWLNAHSMLYSNSNR